MKMWCGPNALISRVYHFCSGKYLPWENCCCAHDVHYITGDICREEADFELKECIEEKGYKKWGWVYYWGCRWFSWPWWDKLRKEDKKNGGH